ncbi:MAG: hypothetical protein QNJ49_09960 [Mastigocoleus sp. MO_167.B18]|nr:hypothetical protein [Mastigocoleus sp. MO_167.B18]
MSLNINILSVLSIGFFAICSFAILHLFFSSPNRDLKRSILIYLLTYGGLNSAFEIFRHRNLPNYGISVAPAIGGTLGFIAGCYFGYQASILVGIFDGVGSIESSSITVTITLTSGVIGLQIGSSLGHILLPI